LYVHDADKDIQVQTGEVRQPRWAKPVFPARHLNGVIYNNFVFKSLEICLYYARYRLSVRGGDIIIIVTAGGGSFVLSGHVTAEQGRCPACPSTWTEW
jgi:hypothetical protein